jgi:hypothetical protein
LKAAGRPPFSANKLDPNRCGGGLAWGWNVDLDHFCGEETLVGRLADGVLSTVVILLIADRVW